MLHNIENNQNTEQDYPGMNFMNVPEYVFVALGGLPKPIGIYTVEEKTGKFVLEGKNLEVNELLGLLQDVDSGVDEYGEFWNFHLFCYLSEENFVIKLYKDRYSTLSLLYSFESLLNSWWQDEGGFCCTAIFSSKHHFSWNTARFSCAVLGIYTNDTLILPSLCIANMQKLFYSSSLAEKEAKLSAIVGRIQAFLLERVQRRRETAHRLAKEERESYDTAMIDEDSDADNNPFFNV
jgi:hypothetical protein